MVRPFRHAATITASQLVSSWIQVRLGPCKNNPFFRCHATMFRPLLLVTAIP